MRFKDWLAEWEGFTFRQAPEFTNGPIFQAAGAGSKYVSKEKGEDDEDDDDDDDEDDNDIDSDEETEMEKIKDLFGFNKDDELDELRKKVRRKTD
ncbi:MAG: hypothetical protein GTO02_16845 [Candidatus Dadabacteria bacterium]|nr:hypothetical protein [Candidatus Dadabacteria bacterium]